MPALQRGLALRSSEITPLLVGQDPYRLTAKQNPSPCNLDPDTGRPTWCWAGNVQVGRVGGGHGLH